MRWFIANKIVEPSPCSRYKQNMRFFQTVCVITLTMVGIPPGVSPRWIPASGPAVAKTATAATLDLHAYLAELDRWSSAAAKLKGAPEQAANLRRLVPNSWKVTICDEQFEVPAEWLRDTLISLETNHQLAADYSSEIQTRLGRMQAEALAMSDQVETADRNRPQEVRERLDRILRQSEFADVHGPTAFDRLRERMRQWLYDRLSRLFGRLEHPSAGRTTIWVDSGDRVAAGIHHFTGSCLSRPP